ncbi:hypothetical protein KI387_014352, partial [Taxus chinensis]
TRSKSFRFKLLFHSVMAAMSSVGFLTKPKTTGFQTDGHLNSISRLTKQQVGSLATHKVVAVLSMCSNYQNRQKLGLSWTETNIYGERNLVRPKTFSPCI